MFGPTGLMGRKEPRARKTDAIGRECHCRDLMRRFCGLFTGTNSSIHTQWPSMASIFSCTSQRSVPPKIWVNPLPTVEIENISAIFNFVFAERDRKNAIRWQASDSDKSTFLQIYLSWYFPKSIHNQFTFIIYSWTCFSESWQALVFSHVPW